MSILLNFHPAVSVIILCAITIALSYIGLRLVRRKFTDDIIRENHEVGGYIFNAFGLIYAVLVAFVVFVTWNEYNDTRSNIDAEASEITDLYNTARAFPDSTKKEIHKALLAYINDITHDEWPLLENGEISLKAKASFENLWYNYNNIDVTMLTNVPLYEESLKHLNDLGERRRTRIFDSRENIPGIIWAALLFGGVMSVVFTYFFRTTRMMPQVVMTSALTILNTLILYMIYLLDHPLRGTMKVTPEAFEYALNIIKAGM